MYTFSFTFNLQFTFRNSVSISNNLSFLFVGWCVADVKEWVIQTFASEAIAQKFEDEEIDGRILVSPTVRSNDAMEKLGLTTLGKKGKFLKATDELAGTCEMPTQIKFFKVSR